MSTASAINDQPEDLGAQDTFVCAVLRDTLAERNATLEQLSPESLDLAALIIGALASVTRGRASRLCGHHPPDYRRGQNSGRNAYTVPDLAWLALHCPEAVRAALVPLAAAVGQRLEPIPETRPWLRTTAPERAAVHSTLKPKEKR